ncbi:MAG: hypothetical protein QM710_00065 [Flavobacterium sp.]
MNNIIYYLIGFFIAVYIARTMGEKAMKYLNTEQKAGLIDLFKKDRKIGSAIIFGLVIGFLLVLQFHLLNPFIAFCIYFLVITGYFVFKIIRTHKILTASNYPKEYIRQMILANIIAAIGMAAFLSLTMFELFKGRE